MRGGAGACHAGATCCKLGHRPRRRVGRTAAWHALPGRGVRGPGELRGPAAGGAAGGGGPEAVWAEGHLQFEGPADGRQHRGAVGEQQEYPRLPGPRGTTCEGACHGRGPRGPGGGLRGDGLGGQVGTAGCGCVRWQLPHRPVHHPLAAPPRCPGGPAAAGLPARGPADGPTAFGGRGRGRGREEREQRRWRRRLLRPRATLRRLGRRA
mmetsp:Transcript_131943/g.422531  ORF Transcript_131943/g.422531 Transcript_131943/m.422531 type:complete len:209 (+) Transcript_131943:517-1143(+)